MAETDSTSQSKSQTRGEKGKSLSQSERFIAKARELGLDEREEAFDAALTKVAQHKPSERVEKTDK